MAAVENIYPQISDPRLERLLNPAPRTVAVGSFVYTPADKAEFFYLLRGGQVKLSRPSQDGRDMVPVILKADWDRPALFGEEAYIGLPFYKILLKL